MADNSRLEIEEKIRSLLVSELNVNAATVATSSSSTPLLGQGIGLDSMEILALVVRLEEEFQISVPDSELTIGHFKDIRTVADYVLKNISETNALRTNKNGNGRA
jgi:acyl carrier protein